MASVSPNDAQSNFSSWLNLVGVEKPPDWVVSPSFDKYMYYIIALSGFSYLMWNFHRTLILYIKNIYVKMQTIKFTDGTHSIHSFGYIISRPHDLCLVENIKLRVYNDSKRPLIIRNAYLRSTVTSQTVTGEFLSSGQNLPAENVQISQKSQGDLYFKLPDTGGHLANDMIRGMTLEDFEKIFSHFEIMIKTNRRTINLNYSTNTTRSWVRDVKMGLMTPPPAEKSQVIKL